MKKILIIAVLCFCVTGAVFAGPHHRHHHHNDGLGLAAGIVNLVGYGLNTILGPRVVTTAPVVVPAAPTRVVIPQTVQQQVVIEPAPVQYVQPAPVVVTQPTVYYQPAPPIYYQPCPPPRGYYRPAPPRHHGNRHGHRGGRR